MNEIKNFPIHIQNRTFNAQVLMKAGVEMVAVSPICEAIGVEEYRQIQKLQSNPQFSCLHMSATGSDGKSYQMACLPLEEVAMWLCNISANRVKPEVREILIGFQRHCQMELHVLVPQLI